jgi:hypothetical protein
MHNESRTSESPDIHAPIPGISVYAIGYGYNKNTTLPSAHMMCESVVHELIDGVHHVFHACMMHPEMALSEPSIRETHSGLLLQPEINFDWHPSI